MKLGLAFVLSLCVVCAADAQISVGGWVLGEFQPDIPNGGRGDGIAVHPTNNDVMIVASESGGLFKTSDRGVHWQHLDGLPTFFTSAVAFVPADPSIVIATARDDFATTTGGGIWRSPDGGTTWAQAAPPPPPSGVTARLNAHEIAIAPDTGTIYVATDYGVSYSIDRGASWNHADPFGSGDRRVLTVAAARGNLVYAGGPAGLRTSPNGGTTWAAPATGPGVFADRHALAVSPVEDLQAYAVNGATDLFYTEDGGNTWTEITSAPSNGDCGGIAFVKATYQERRILPLPNPPVRFVDLWYGNRCGLALLRSPELPGTPRFNYSWTAWDTATLDHIDTRDLAFTTATRPAPLLLATDGGLHAPSNAGLTWTYTGGGRNGYNALQLTEVKGQWIRDIGRYDLYIATQDNDLWASTDGGTTWGNNQCCEGFFIERLPSVATASDSKITFVACDPCVDQVADPGFTNVGNWPDATNPPEGNPKIIFSRFHVQGVDGTAGFTKGYAATQNLGGSWLQYATFPEDRRDLPKLTDNGIPVLYQAILNRYDWTRNHEINTFARAVRNLMPLTPTASVRYPLMNNFGGLGVNPTMFAFYQVFGADPYDTRHVIAPDVVNQKMMKTNDGGDNWTEIPSLTSMVTDSGRFIFNRNIVPHASVVSFSNEDPDLVAVGTMQGGLFISGDRGATWSHVPGSEKATIITSIEWKNLTEATVSTYGRGLWKLWWRIRRPWKDFDRFCRVPCFVRWLDEPGGFQNWGDALFVLNGTIQGAVVSDGAVKELFVSPGGSVASFSDNDLTPARVTESLAYVGFTGIKVPEAPKDTPLVLGLALVGGKVEGVAFSDKPVKPYELTQKEKDAEKDPAGSEKSPTAGMPYVSLDAGNGVRAGAPIRVDGLGFPPKATVKVLVDNQAVQQTNADDKGRVTITVTAPRAPGLHSLKTVDAEGQPFAGAMFLVRHVDARPSP